MSPADVIAFAARVGVSSAKAWLDEEGMRLAEDAVSRIRTELARLIGDELRVDAGRLVIVDEREHDDPTI